MRLKLVGDFDGLQAVVSGSRLVTLHSENECEAHRGILVVVDDENTAAARFTRRVEPGRARLGCRRRLPGRWQPHHELGAFGGTFAVRLDRAGVHLDESLDQRQADAEPTLGTLEGVVDLHEHVEYTREHFLRDADSVVDDSDDHGIIRLLGFDLDAATARRVLRGIVQQVGEHLRESDDVAVERDLVRREIDAELVLLRLDDRRARLDGVTNNPVQRHALFAQRNPIVGDAAHVDEIVDEPDHLTELHVHHAPRAVHQICVALDRL